MSTKQTDREIVAIIAKKLGIEIEEVVFEVESEDSLNIISSDPHEAAYENDSLIYLELTGLNSTQILQDLWQLSSLQMLNLSGNQLREIPVELGKLSQLRKLSLFKNQLREVQPVLWQLKQLRKLHLADNQLEVIPAELDQLTQLQALNLGTNQLSEIPRELGQLSHLKELDLQKNQLRELPAELGQLNQLKELDLDGNQLSELPAELGQLSRLQVLYLQRNQLRELPAELGQLSRLQVFYLQRNQLRELPAELGQLSQLRELHVGRNQLRELPRELGQLSNLEELYLMGNQLRQLPLEFCLLPKLQTVHVEENPDLLTPPPEIVAKGTPEMLTYLRELLENGTIRYEAKLLVVGEGGTGKTSLLRALCDDTFEPHLSTTHGIEINQLKLSHSRHELTLNTWDFGGQHIYHTTHQFFLTKRSLYLIVWNARLGAEQGRLHYWLETIKALAPDVPVLLVATHIDERPPDINLQLYEDAYPQVIGNVSVSNKDGSGIAQLKARLAEEAATLPLMGQPWPSKWLAVEKELLAHPQRYIDADGYVGCCTECGVDGEVVKGTLGDYLHDLGKILYFRDDYLLSNLVVLKPNWVTQAISRVLDDDRLRLANGILPHADLRRIWDVDEDGQRYEQHLYPLFLRLMERFEISYQIEDDMPGEVSTRSLVPLLLPHQPPENLPPWPDVPPTGQSQVEMVYRLDAVPAGIMSRFIVRTHRYTRNLHWREGGMLEYQGHQARVEMNPLLRELKLLVQGVLPQNFFTILMHTIDEVLARFEGLTIRREIPCVCHWNNGADEGQEPCPRYYRHEDLVRRMQAGRHRVECPESFEEVSVPLLLYGIHSSTHEQVMHDIQKGQKEIKQSIEKGNQEIQEEVAILLQYHRQQTELIARGFARQWNLEMQKMEAECPGMFMLLPANGKKFNPKNWVSREYSLHLLCQHPGGPHRVGEAYTLRKSKEWWSTVSPWLNRLIEFLKYGVPMGRALGELYDATFVEEIKGTLDLVEEITGTLPAVSEMDNPKTMSAEKDDLYAQRAYGAALRNLRSFLEEADPACTWGGLSRTVTPDGNIFWLCEEHRKQYEARPLRLDTRVIEVKEVE